MLQSTLNRHVALKAKGQPFDFHPNVLGNFNEKNLERKLLLKLQII